MLIYPEEHLASQVKPQQMSQSSKLLFKTRRQLVVGFACCGLPAGGKRRCVGLRLSPCIKTLLLIRRQALLDREFISLKHLSSKFLILLFHHAFPTTRTHHTSIRYTSSGRHSVATSTPLHHQQATHRNRSGFLFVVLKS